ncbi:DUF2125 domain-containing protein [Paragemmobacter straminiformis]|uniref:DUF2125 domain-containing protein n=1 Tax=Paragemmobacter straminiformis TaxID=2045119 RepID=A0A842I7D1_9RHOB|nr:DUF2125 domain-containing protein [Gemmobacter straminiformis]MBC2834888.1 DUF2125 domain-containing protein [Gemmobacter straminiformis]
MRALLVAVLIAAILWAGYWVVGSRLVEREVTAWFAAPHGDVTAAQSDITVLGFPNRFDLTVTDPALADTARGWGWRAPFAQVFMMTWKPWHLIAALPQEQEIDTPFGPFRLTSSQFEGSLVMIPGTALALDRTVVSADNPALLRADGWEVSATKATFATRLAPDDAKAHEIGIEVTTLTPPAEFRMALANRSALPEQVEKVRLDMVATFTAPIDRFAAVARPRLSALRVKEGLLRWGDMVISANGEVSPAADGTAEGRIELRVQNWRELVPVLVAAGLVTAEVSPTVTRAMELLSEQGANPDVLDIPLVMQSGRMTLGPLPLGPAPQMF